MELHARTSRRRGLPLLTLFLTSIGWPALAIEPVDAVDPLIGVMSENCIIGPSLPHGSIHPSPQSLDIYEDWRWRPGNDGYSPYAEFVGFAQLHAQGTGGTPSYGQLLITPRYGVAVEELDHLSPTSEERARIHEYSVHLDRWNVDCAVAPAHHAAVYEFTFADTGRPVIVVNAGRKIRGEPSLVEGEVSWTGPAELSGTGRYANNWMPGEHPLAYVIDFDRTPVETGVFGAGEIENGGSRTYDGAATPRSVPTPSSHPAPRPSRCASACR